MWKKYKITLFLRKSTYMLVYIVNIELKQYTTLAKPLAHNYFIRLVNGVFLTR